MDRKLTLDLVSEEAEDFEAGLCGRVELVMPLQLFHSNLTYAALCTITSFEALIKATSSSTARKQQQKQRNKWFSSKPNLMFTSTSSRPTHLATTLLISFTFSHSSHPPTDFSYHLLTSSGCHRLTNPLVEDVHHHQMWKLISSVQISGDLLTPEALDKNVNVKQSVNEMIAESECGTFSPYSGGKRWERCWCIWFAKFAQSEAVQMCTSQTAR